MHRSLPVPTRSPGATAPDYHRYGPKLTEFYPIIKEHELQFVEEIERLCGHVPKFIRWKYEDDRKCGLLEPLDLIARLAALDLGRN